MNNLNKNKKLLNILLIINKVITLIFFITIIILFYFLLTNIQPFLHVIETIVTEIRKLISLLSYGIFIV